MSNIKIDFDVNDEDSEKQLCDFFEELCHSDMTEYHIGLYPILQMAMEYLKLTDSPMRDEDRLFDMEVAALKLALKLLPEEKTFDLKQMFADYFELGEGLPIELKYELYGTVEDQE